MKASLLIALVPCALSLVACGRADSPDRSDTAGGANTLATPSSSIRDGSSADTRTPDANEPSHATIPSNTQVSGRETQPGEGTGNGPATGTGPTSDSSTTTTNPVSGAGTPPINGSGGRMPSAPPPAPPITP